MKTSKPEEELDVHERNDEIRKQEEAGEDPAYTTRNKVGVVLPAKPPNGTPFGKVPE